MLSAVCLLWLCLLAPAIAFQDAAQRCANLADTDIENAHSIKTVYLHANESYLIPGPCDLGTSDDLHAPTSVNVCAVSVVYNTSSTSATRIETWLPDPDAWYGRILGTGGGGLGGCVDYQSLQYGTSLHFAAFGHNGGHDGMSGAPFASSDEVIVDFAHRGLHVASVASKTLVEEYYGRKHDKSYYTGCSTGGRQGFRSVQDYPDDFDGVLAGAPAVNEVHLLAAGGLYSIAAQKLDPQAWELIKNETLRQCDAMDGLVDSIIDYPESCAFLPEALLCDGEKREGCLSTEQVEAVRMLYSPVYDKDGQLLSARINPGSEQELPADFGQDFPPVGLDWWRYIVYNDSSWQPTAFGSKEIDDAEQRDSELPVSSFNPKISAFRERGGKLLSYHGNSDIAIPSGNSLLYYQLVARTLSLPPTKMDDFYRLFLIPGMNHCYFGPGAWMFGQIGFASWANSSDSNALLALVDWVENGKAPETLHASTDGSVDTIGPKTRFHCKYPARSVWKEDVQNWVCS